MYWWTEDILERRKKCLKARRACKRVRRRKAQDESQTQCAVYKEARRKLKVVIIKSKTNYWRKLCLQVESDLWGLPYKLVTKKLLGRRPIQELSTPGRLQTVVNALFPSQATINWPILASPIAFPEVNYEEIRKHGSGIPLGKAPSPNGVPDMIIKQVAAHRPEVLSKVFNLCLREGLFLAA